MRCKICLKSSSWLDADNWNLWQICYGCAIKIHRYFKRNGFIVFPNPFKRSLRCKICHKQSSWVDSFSWHKWEICPDCSISVHTHYKDKRIHGTGGTYTKPIEVKSMIE